jgi:hypothetical protein
MCLVKSNLPILNVRLFGYLGLTLKKLEDTKWVFRSPNSKNDIQCNGKPKKKDKHRSTKHYIEHQRSMNTNPMKIGGQLMCYGRVGSSCSHEAPIVLLLLQTRWYGMNDETTGLWFQQTEYRYIRGHLWHRYSLKVNQVMVTTVKRSKWWLQLNH